MQPQNSLYANAWKSLLWSLAASKPHGLVTLALAKNPASICSSGRSKSSAKTKSSLQKVREYGVSQVFTFLTGEQEIFGSDLREGVLMLRAAYPIFVVATAGCRARSGRWLRPQPQVWLTLHHACYFKVRPLIQARGVARRRHLKRPNGAWR